MRRPGLAAMAAAVGLTIGMQALAEDLHKQALMAGEDRVQLQSQVTDLQEQVKRFGLEISDIRIQVHADSQGMDQPAFGCTVSRYQSVEGIPGEVRVEAFAANCLEALAMLDEV